MDRLLLDDVKENPTITASKEIMPFLASEGTAVNE
jgi:hypothetical protein